MHHATVVLIIASTCFLLLGIGFGVLILRLMSPERLQAFRDGLPEQLFSPGRYRVIERLLNESEYRFLRSHPAWNSRMEKNLRKDRTKIFRGYLHELSGDFHQICKAVKLLMVTSRIDRPDLAKALIKQQFGFAMAMTVVEFRLILYRSGWTGVSVDVGDLVRSVDAVRVQLQSLAAIIQPVEQPSPA